MDLRKYDYASKQYKKLAVPDSWNCITYSSDMDEKVNCPQCGKEVFFGDTYTSMEVHDRMGMGYAVCEECHQKEWSRRRKAERLGYDY